MGHPGCTQGVVGGRQGPPRQQPPGPGRGWWGPGAVATACWCASGAAGGSLPTLRPGLLRWLQTRGRRPRSAAWTTGEVGSCAAGGELAEGQEDAGERNRGCRTSSSPGRPQTQVRTWSTGSGRRQGALWAWADARRGGGAFLGSHPLSGCRATEEGNPGTENVRFATFLLIRYTYFEHRKDTLLLI